jgi:hypothetical protein
MAKIGSDRMIVRGEHRQDNSWLFTICYTAYFSENDLGMRFDDSVRVGDGEGDDDYVQPVSFTATGPKVFRKKRIVVPGDVLTNAAASDVVCAWIRLHCETSPGADDDERRTPVPVPVQLLRC